MKKETLQKIYDLRDFVKSSETVNAREFIISRLNEILACEMNEQKIGKLNLYDFCDAKGSESYQGIVHQNGYKYACDGKILAKLKADYQEEFEGKSVKKDGSFMPDNTRIPRYESVIPNTEGWKEFKVDFDKFTESKKMANVHWNQYKKSSDYRAIVSLNNEIHLNYWRFEKVLKFMREIGTDIVYYKDKANQIVAKSEIGVCILMPLTFMEEFEDCHFLLSMNDEDKK